jgi:hypothetical protein
MPLLETKVTSVNKPKKQQPGIFAPMAPQGQYQLPSYPPVPVPFPVQAGVPESVLVQVQVLTDPHATVARATLSADGYGPAIMTATGWSKRDNADEYDPETGTAIAVKRALENLARKLGRQAGGRIKHADSVRRDREEARRKRAAKQETPPARHAKPEEGKQ